MFAKYGGQGRSCNDLTGLSWLRKALQSRERRAHLGLGSWAGVGWFKPKSPQRNRELAKGARLRMGTDAVVRQVLRNLAYAGHRARTIRVQREAGSVWFSALSFDIPPRADIPPALPRLFSSKRQRAAPLRKSLLPDILQDIREAGCDQYSPKACD